MTIISVRDLDNQMGRTIDPNSVPKHDGASLGSMEADIQRGPNNETVQQGAGRFGGTVVDRESVGGGDRFYGSTTIISLKEAPPLQDKHDPDVVVLQAAPIPVARPKAPPFIFPKVVAKPPVAMPVAPPVPVRTPDALLRQMGLKKRP